ncbi:MAG: hypothetical protein ACKPEN_11240 [Planktothrix sp.]|uniref:hypothetical protein n=1 Tax=Planktothrix sp. TaxID=3088171 RepID=UPI0038D46423
MKIILATDSEFVPKLDNPTEPLSLTIEDEQGNARFYIHPNASKDVLKHTKKIGDKIFKHDFAILDFLEDVYGFKVGKKLEGVNYKNYVTLVILIFFSFKDIEFLFKNTKDYEKLVLPKLSRTRRISVQNIINNSKGGFCSDSIGLPYIATLPDKNNGRMRNYKISFKIVDICAMQGNDNLKNYANNVGIEMLTKDEYTSDEKKRMDLRYIENSNKYKAYCMGDTPLIKVKRETDNFYNHIAELIGVEKQISWGMSTGKIVARLLNDWFCNILKIDSKTLYKIHNLAGSEGITNISKLIKEKALIYGAMVDGGRTVRERDLDILVGNLIDIDISGCYGNGLKNQLYAIGIPSIITEPMIVEDWLNKYEKELIPGLWCARISWDNSKSKFKFKQDLLISKTEEKFSFWNYVIQGFDNQGFEIDDDGKKVYDASMCTTTSVIHYATLTHDSLQILKTVASNQEWGWIKKNAVINCSLIYKKSDEVSTPTDEMLEGATLSKDTDTLIKASKNWIRIELKGLITTLLLERKKHPKKTPMNTFLKLIINTIYGTIASEFFSIENACVSSVVIGNNITARARCLAWCMGKGFHSVMSITDGGVFDVNNVLFYKKKSLNLLEGLHRDKLSEGKNRFCYKKPLMGFEINFNNPNCYKLMLENLGIIPDIDDKKNKYTCLNIIDKKAWEHLSSIFDIDIFNYNQFEFETKDIYTKLILHSKVDYYLEKPNNSGYTIAFRGMPKVWDDSIKSKVINPLALDLFKAIENNTPLKVEIDTSELLSLSDYQIKKKSDGNYPLLPHDSVNVKKVFYSHSPKSSRVASLSELKKLEKRYETAKKSENAIEVAAVKKWGEKLSKD